MALVAHMSIEGKSQGNITKGCSRLKGREDTVEVYEFQHAIDIPKDQQSGRIIGQRFHSPVSITKELDKSSPLLALALTTAEQLTITLRFYRFAPDGSGKQEQFYTIKLEEAQLISYHAELPFVKDPEEAQYPLLDRLQIAFRRIECTYEDGGITFDDDWISPVA